MLVRLGIVVVALFALVTVAGAAQNGEAGASLTYVDGAGDCAGLNPCYTTIRLALVDAEAPAEVRVFPSVYPESVNLAEVSPQGDIALVTADAGGEPAPGTATIHAAAGPGIQNGVPYNGAIVIDGFVVESETEDGLRLETNVSPVTVRNVVANDQGDGQAVIPGNSEPPGTGDDGVEIATDTGEYHARERDRERDRGPERRRD